MFQFPRLAFIPYVFRNKYLLLISANPNPDMPQLASRHHQTSELQISKVGFPIRKFTDQSLFAAPHDLSQRTTSFIASQRQGIHRIPLRHLIALIIDAHRSAAADLLPVKENKPLGSIIKDQFASNTPEDVAVMLRPLTESLAFGDSIAKAIGCISSLRCKITRLGGKSGSTPDRTKAKL